jgi:hypothetical protein
MTEVGRSSTLSLWDVFANIVPGIVLIIGLGLPFLPGPGGMDTLPLDLIELALIGVLAMVAGLALQGPAYFLEEAPKLLVKRNGTSATRVLERIRPISFQREFERLEEPSTPFEEQFWAFCASRFDLGNDFGNREHHWAQLWKLLLTHLESSPYTQTVRWRSMYSMARGLWVGFGVLLIYYLLLITYRPDPPIRMLTYVIIASGSLAVVFFAFKNWFKRLWFEFMILEFYLDEIRRLEARPSS